METRQGRRGVYLVGFSYQPSASVRVVDALTRKNVSRDFVAARSLQNQMQVAELVPEVAFFERFGVCDLEVIPPR